MKPENTRRCPICKNEYDDGGNYWKRVCYDCYKDFKFLHYDKHPVRIKESLAYKAHVYMTHPSVTREELQEWIKTTGKESGWGVEEWSPGHMSKYKTWVDSVDFD